MYLRAPIYWLMLSVWLSGCVVNQPREDLPHSPNHAAIGAWVEVTAGGVTQRRQVMPNRSYMSQVEGVLTFGLGAAEAVDQVEIFWPDGRREVVAGVETDRLLRVEQDG